VVLIALAALSVVHSWLGGKSSRIHRRALARCSSEEIRQRATDWVSNPSWKPAPELDELREHLEQGRYRTILRHWLRYSLAMSGAVEWDMHEGPPLNWILRDYLRVLVKRELAGR